MKVHMLSILLCAVVSLQGCVSAVVIGTTVVATKTSVDRRTIGTQVDDSTLEARIANALAKDQFINKNNRVINTVYQGKVLLTGQAPTPVIAARARKIAIGVDGTNEVYNAIRRGKPVSLGRASLDAWITTKVFSKLLVSDAVKSCNVKVITENSEVFLLGLVTHAEGKTAANIASKVTGVKHVYTAFTYLK
ncbi:division/outer membrane stress-associated lipid-binding lipoprotein [secondary endosymbiont of Ctenarytaina eucalypti]|uniref:Putative periplasmic or secreted lipoprotein n=1 Tax=secondary endosymbiont of Ctenarytaina eucalypti TaxID=1199245 RepID=J3YS13_9ENTR|nr:division/outer membrane stress-associated lipid-binding lipoprotein [secondary endosymbiont of Ctenarytaina eucalypti]AFP84903.1 putative periplasmic or secreted lipoprotein [secondary endosymbiont of Ctenarytaina eucalypti]